MWIVRCRKCDFRDIQLTFQYLAGPLQGEFKGAILATSP